MANRLLVCRARLGPFACALVRGDRVVGPSRLLRMPRHHLRLRRPAGALGDQRRHYPPVKLPPRSLQERLVRRLLHERVLEGVGRTRRLPAREEDLRLHEPPELVSQRRLSHPHDGRQQGVRELPPQHGRALRHLLRAR